MARYKLNKDLIQRISKVVEVGGVTMKCALAAVAISAPTYYKWRRYAVEAQKKKMAGEKLNKRERLYIMLDEEVEAARDRCFVRNLNCIAAAAPKDWRAAMQAAKMARPELAEPQTDEKWRRAVADFARGARQAISQNTSPETAQKILEAIEALAENRPREGDQLEGV